MRNIDLLRVSSEDGQQKVIGKVVISRSYSNIEAMMEGRTIKKRLFRKPDGTFYFRHNNTKWHVNLMQESEVNPVA